MAKLIIAYILLFFGVTIAIIGTVYYLRMYKTMIGTSQHKKFEDQDNSTSCDKNLQNTQKP